MPLYSQDRRCVTIQLPAGTALSSGGVQLLVRYAQHRCGAAPWGGIAADLFRAPEETLVLARPAVITHVTFADWACRFIHNYFTD